MDREYTAEEKQKMIEQHEKKQKKLYTRGRNIVFTIAIVNVIGAIISAFVQLNYFSLTAQLVFSALLFFGVSWVKYLFVAGNILAIIFEIQVLFFSGLNIFEQISQNPQALEFFIYAILLMIFSLVASILLLFSKSVSTFLYAQKNG